jgi:hypothetical protein
MVASQQRRKYDSRRISIVEVRYLAMASENRLRRLSVCCSEESSAWISKSVIITCSYEL